MINYDDPWQENYNIDIASSSYVDFVKSLRSVGIKTSDLYSSTNVFKKNDPYLYNFKRDIHWKPKGAKVTARAITSLLLDYPDYSSLTKVNTVLKLKTQISRDGTITEELRRLCKNKIEAEIYDTYKATQIFEKTSDALFGSVKEITPVALVGTSFSSHNVFNFAYYLEKFSKLSISNFSIVGGGMFTAIISYLSSPYFHENPPPIIIWETQTVYNYNKGVEYLFRQVIPAVEGVCSDSQTLAQNNIEIIDNKPYVLLNNLEEQKIHGTDYYLHIFADNLGFKTFTLEMEYDDQDGEWFPIDRSDRYNNKGHYFIELSDKITSNISSITIKDTNKYKTGLNVRLCKKTKKE